MKQFLRIFVVVIIMIGLGFGTYALFFKPANKEEVYLALAGVSELDEKYKYDASVQSVSKGKFNPTVADGYNQEIAELYQGVLTSYNELVNVVDGGVKTISVKSEDSTTAYSYTQYTYPQLKLYMDEVFNYYFAYSQAVSKTISKSKLKEIKTAVANYEVAISNLTNKGFYEIEALQNYIMLNKSQDYSKEFGNRYRRVIELYRNYIGTYANLIEVTKQFVTDYVFRGEMITDRESLLYDLMIESLSKAVAGEYDFDNPDNRKSPDDYMKSATQFVGLAMSNNKNAALSEIYGYDAHTVLVNSSGTKTAYVPKTWNYYKINVKFRINDQKDALYFDDSNIVAIESSGGALTINASDVVTIKTTKQASGVTKDVTKQAAKGYVNFTCYVNNTDLNKLYFYDDENSHLATNQHWIALSEPLVISGSQVVLSDSEGEKVSYTYDLEFKNYYEVGGNCYELKNSTTLGMIGGTGTIDNIVYYENNFYSSTNYIGGNGAGSGESLNYKRMVKCYNKIMEESPEDLSKLIDLSYDQKIAFVLDEEIDGVRIRSNFVEVLHEEVEYLLAGCGFYKEA